MKLFGLKLWESCPFSESGYVVEAVSWELKGGLYHIAYPIGMAILAPYKLITGGMKAIPPRRIIHSGVIVHGCLYEYSTEGVKKTKASKYGDPGSACNVGRFWKREVIGTTYLTLKQFDTWVAKQKKNDFTKEKYCVAYNHCNHFSIKAAEFLGVTPLLRWRQMVTFTENNPRLCELARGSATASS